jgi:PAS domain-containing protein
LTVLLDQIACGLVLVDAQARVRYLNLAALRQLDSLHPLVLAGQTLQTRDPEDLAPAEELHWVAACLGQRRLVTLGHAKQTTESERGAAAAQRRGG